MMKRSQTFLVVLALTLTGCSLLSPVNEPEANTYALTAEPMVANAEFNSGKTLLVSMPRAGAGYTSAKMAYTQHAYQVEYFSKNTWIETPAHMLFPLIVQTLQRSHYYHAVVAAPFSGQADLRLDTAILKLEQDFTTSPNQLALVVRVRLINTLNQKVIAVKTFDLREPIQNQTPYSGVIAANRAVEKFLEELAIFCGHEVERHQGDKQKHAHSPAHELSPAPISTREKSSALE